MVWRLSRLNQVGLTGLMAVLLTVALWMLPSMVDRAVVEPATDAAKLLSLWGAGWVLRGSMQRAPAPVQLFFVGYALPMAVWLGVYFASTDLRLCNAYSLQSQVDTGRGLVALAALIGTAWLWSWLRPVSADPTLSPGLPRPSHDYKVK
ncbi:MAG: hypothetical protein H7Z19_14295 [Chitinophagaceae bacterium]|nr:hypothetical protein [Rubrivivax sp.]